VQFFAAGVNRSQLRNKVRGTFDPLTPAAKNCTICKLARFPLDPAAEKSLMF
jgi:hypothetical protein